MFGPHCSRNASVHCFDTQLLLSWLMQDAYEIFQSTSFYAHRRTAVREQMKFDLIAGLEPKASTNIGWNGGLAFTGESRSTHITSLLRIIM
jgi:hypothetical protein